MDKLDQVLKYGKPEFSLKLEGALEVWEAMAACVERREQLLKELNNLKNSVSALNKSKPIRERMSRMAVALCEHTRDAQHLMDTLDEQYYDTVMFAGKRYDEKIQADLSQELIDLLPEAYEYKDLIYDPNSRVPKAFLK